MDVNVLMRLKTDKNKDITTIQTVFLRTVPSFFHSTNGATSILILTLVFKRRTSVTKMGKQ